VIFRATFALAFCASFLVARANGVQADESKVRQRDPLWKFSLYLFSAWKPVPLPPLDAKSDAVEHRLAARYICAGSELPAEWTLPDGTIGVAEFYVIPAGETGEMEAVLSQAARRRVMAFPPHPPAKAVKTTDGAPGTSWSQDTLTRSVASAVWKKDDRQLGLWMAGRFTTAKDLARVVGSVTWSDPGASGAAVNVSALDGLKLSPERRKAIERGLVKDWKVLLSPTKQYIVVFNNKAGKNAHLAQVIAARIEAIRRQQYEVMFPPIAPVETVSVVRVCGDEDEYRAYGGPRGSGGYWNHFDEELVFFDADRSSAPDDDTLSVLYHEAFHQYVFYAAGRVAPHSWFNEGHGDFFAGARWKDGKFRIEPFAWRLETLDRALGLAPPPEAPLSPPTVSFIPLDRLVAMSRREYYGRPSLAYAQGWSLVYFLRVIVPKTPEWKEKWGGILDTYFRTLREVTARAKAPVTPRPDPSAPAQPPADETAPEADATVPPPSGEAEVKDALDAARTAAFDGVDFSELEKAWKSSIVVLLSPRVASADAPRGRPREGRSQRDRS
jgi:hypothetical protein